jgi:erythromycin esterase-like protein
LHDLSLNVAKKRIIEECRDADVFETVIFIHGFNSGTAIRNYIRSGPLVQSLESRKIKFEMWHNQQGTTFFNKLK